MGKTTTNLFLAPEYHAPRFSCSRTQEGMAEYLSNMHGPNTVGNTSLAAHSKYLRKMPYLNTNHDSYQ